MKTKQITLRIPQELYTQLKKEAEREGVYYFGDVLG